MEEQEPVQVIVVEPVADGVAAVVRVLEKLKQVEILSVPTAEEAWQVALQFAPCMLFVSLPSAAEGALQVEMLKRLEKSIRAGQVKPLVLSGVKRHPLARAIAMLGVIDYAEEPIPTKSLLFKVNLTLKAILASRRQKANKPEAERVFKSEGKSDADASENTFQKVAAKYKPALQLAEDTFVFKGKVRKSGTKYILSADGPDPTTGEWIEEPGTGTSSSKWRWQPKIAEGVTPEEKSGSGWVHEGERPVFHPKDGQWQMKSARPGLYYRRHGEKVGTKVETDEDGSVVIAEDSQAAMDNLAMNRTFAAQIQDNLVRQALAAEGAKRRSVQEREAQSKKQTPARTGESESSPQGDEAPGPEVDGNPGVSGEPPDELASREKREREGGFKKEKESLKPVKESQDESSHGSVDPPLDDEMTRKLGGVNKGATEVSNRGKGHEIHFQEEKLEGLAKEDLESEHNLRDRMPSALRKKIQSEDPRDSKQLTLEHDDKKPEPKSITGELSQRAEAIKESRVSEEVHDPEAEGAAPKRPAENDLFREAEAREIKRAERKARRKCSELKQALLEEEGKAPREDLTEAEERALRQELGVVDSAAIGKAELAKRSKAARVKALRDRLEEVQASLEGGGGALLAMFPSEEQDDWGEPEAEDEPKARNFRVIESEEEAESEEIEEAVRAKKQGKGSGGKLGGEEEIFFLDRKEVTPENGYWECERGCWVYLPNSVFEKGFARAKELLPCWVFRGKVEPELLLGEGKWKFLGSPPFKIAFVEKLPRPIRDLLAALHAQTRLANENGAPVRSEQGPAEGGADSAALKEAPEREAGSIENEPNGEAGNGKVRSEEGRGQSLGKVGRIDEDDKSNEGAVTRELNERESSIGSVRVEDDSGKNAALRREDEGERQGFRNIDEIVPAAPKTELELGAGDSSPGSIGHREILFLAAMADLFQSGIEDRPTLIGVLLGLESYMKGVRFGCILAGEGAIIDSSGSVFRGDDFARIQFFSTKPTNSENRNAGLAIGFLDVGRRLSHRESALLKRLLPVLSQLMGNVGKEEGEKKDAA